MRSYTKYQQEVIRELTKTLTDRTFEYSKAQNNHLKIIIEGVKSPLFTSATPSDHRAFHAFMSEVRCKVREAEAEESLALEEATTEAPVSEKEVQQPKDKMSQVIEEALEHLGKAKAKIIDSESSCINSKADAQVVLSRRQELIKATLKRVAKSNGVKLKASDTRKAMREITQQFYCLLPQIGDYKVENNDKADHHEALELKDIIKASAPKKQVQVKVAHVQEQKTEELSESDVDTKHGDCTESTEDTKQEPHPVEQLLGLGKCALTHTLESLTNKELVKLLAIAKDAHDSQYKENLSKVMSLINEFGIKLEDITEAANQ